LGIYHDKPGGVSDLYFLHAQGMASIRNIGDMTECSFLAEEVIYYL
jgi:hypothetical protein